jgi:hypothetical protein
VSTILVEIIGGPHDGAVIRMMPHPSFDPFQPAYMEFGNHKLTIESVDLDARTGKAIWPTIDL